MKKLLLLISIILSINVAAQDDKTLTLTVSGQGKTQEEAKQVALRSAIEQAFGTFISSKTEILNDKLVKDEIVSVTNGNIQKFDVLSEVQLPDGGYATTLKAIVSVTKLTSFCENKGVEVEFKGGLFAANIKMQKLNEEAEYKTILNLCKVSKELLSKSLDYSLSVSEPVAYNNSTDNYSIKFIVTFSTNNNEKIFENYFWKTLSNIAMSEDEKQSYKQIEKPVFKIFKSTKFNEGDGACNHCNLPVRSNGELYNLRNKKSLSAIKNLMVYSNSYLYDFRIISEIDTISIKQTYTDKFGAKISNVDRKLLDNPDQITAHERLESYKELGSRQIETWSLWYNYYYGFPQCVFGNNGGGGDYGASNGMYYFQIITEEEFPSNFDAENLNLYVLEKSSLPIQFYYTHILRLDKLEKISKYKIEPWINNTTTKVADNSYVKKMGGSGKK